ncbi:DUF6644 family protein [Novosphingobium sp. Rr 2-17]|uniref:DUF6644 family protein n=1 Tax=Novosphingobium sp. Rr 2-17 TaxID=555793 RepID=UPI0002D7EEAD|nr:DUF6644 family protein [Novosphingobium sp. Rr 2-17]
MQQDQYAFSVCETIHFFGLCLLLGAILVIDLRLLGLMKRTPVDAVMKFVPIAFVGFALNLLTGICFLAYNPAGYATNWMFWLKMSLVLLAGLNMLFFSFVEHPRILKTPAGGSFGTVTRICAVLSLTLWIAVIIAGRLLPVTQGAAGKG